MVDGRFLQDGADSGQDYWTVAGEIDLSRAPTGTAPTKPAAAYKVVGHSVPRLDLPGQGDGCRLRARCPAGRPAACARVAPARPRRDFGDARRGGDPKRGQGRAADRARGQLRRIRQPGRRRGPGSRRGGAAARDLGQRPPHRTGAAGSGVAQGPARHRPHHRRATRRPAAEAAVRGSPCRGPTSRTRRWRPPARSPSSRTAISPCGRTARACIRCGAISPPCSACRSRRSPRAICTAPAATATTAPTMPRSTPR